MPRRLRPWCPRRARSSSAAIAGPPAKCSAAAIQAGLQAAGRSTLDAGIVATPTVGVLVRHCRAGGGIAVTASHNPLPYNGIKLFSAEGRVLPAEAGQQVLTRYRLGEAARPFHGPPGTRQTVADPLSCHLEAVLATVDVERIRGCRFQVVLDSNRGAGGPLGRRLLEALGCRVTLLGEATDGRFRAPGGAHRREPRRRAGRRARGRRRHRFLPGPRRRSAGGDRPRGPLPGRRVYRGVVRRARAAAAAGTDRGQLRQQPHVGGRRPAPRRAPGPLGGGRGERRRCHDRARGRLRRRGQRRADRSPRRPGPRQFRRHGPTVGRDGRAEAARSANWRPSCPATRS